MPEKKWFKGRPIRRTKKQPGGLIKLIFDDGPPGIPGDSIYVTEDEYMAKEGENLVNLRREFIRDGTSKQMTQNLGEVGTPA